MASRSLFQRIGMASSLPTIAIGTIGHAGAHRDLHEPAAAEPAELVALAHELARWPWCPRGTRARAAVVVQEPVRVVGMRGDTAGARPQRAEHRQRAEEVLGQPVHRAQQLGLDAVHDDRRVRRDRAAVVGDQERAAARAGRARAPPTRRAASSGRRGRRACGRARAPRSLRPHPSTRVELGRRRRRPARRTPACESGDAADRRRRRRAQRRFRRAHGASQTVRFVADATGTLTVRAPRRSTSQRVRHGSAPPCRRSGRASTARARPTARADPPSSAATRSAAGR